MVAAEANEPPARGGILSAVEIDPLVEERPFDWERLFGNRQPVEVEIGCGKGKFLAEAALGSPQVNYLGVERAGKYYRKAVARLSKTGLANVRLMRADGLDLLDRWIAPAAVRRIHVYFPDPWPKKRHHKRRIFGPALLELAARALPAGGELLVATDHAEYAEIIADLFRRHARLFTSAAWPEDAPDRPATHYSIKWQRAGRPLWWGRYRRLSG